MKKTAWKGYKWLCLGRGGNRAVLMKVGIWEGDFLGKKVGRETSECSILRQAFPGMAFLSSFGKQILFLDLFMEATVLDLSHSRCPQTSNEAPGPSLLSDFTLAPAGAKILGHVCLHRRAKAIQSPPHPALQLCFAEALGLQHWPSIEYLPRPLPFLINSL